MLAAISCLNYDNAWWQQKLDLRLSNLHAKKNVRDHIRENIIRMHDDFSDEFPSVRCLVS